MLKPSVMGESFSSCTSITRVLRPDTPCRSRVLRGMRYSFTDSRSSGVRGTSEYRDLMETHS